jgi:SAM-dependent methyltransferase
VTAYTVFDLFFGRYRENFNYFYFRLGQPRHLVALSFASLIRQPTSPLLDLACGCGHITRSLLARAHGQPVIGVDNAFLGLYIAKRWIAPEAEYVCCIVDTSLPFADGTFSVAFCSDAFHYLANKASIMRELTRVTQPDGLMQLVWVHNALVRRPHDGLPLPPQGYQALLVDIPHRLIADDDVLRRYRQKQGPPLAHAAEARDLAQAPLLSIVASQRQETFQDYGTFQDWPHAEGRLTLNPLYAVEGRDALGNTHLRRVFPSVFYAEDHVECKDYLPETVEVPREVWTSHTAGKRTPQMERLIEQCVLLGAPDCYRGDR